MIYSISSHQDLCTEIQLLNSGLIILVSSWLISAQVDFTTFLGENLTHPARKVLFKTCRLFNLPALLNEWQTTWLRNVLGSRRRC